MRMRVRCAALGLLLLATALAGCSVAPRYEKGEPLSTESRVIGREPEYKLRGLGRLELVPPRLVAWVDVRNKVLTEQRDICQKVEVAGRRRLSFEPAFLLWPWNVLRTPVGLVGCVFSGSDMALHYVAAGVGAVAGVAGSVVSYAFLGTTSIVGLGQVSDTTGYGLAADFAQLFIFLLETPLLVLDVPHKFLHGTPLYPVAMNRKEFPEKWGEGISRSWRYAWDYKLYPPFLIWYRTEETRQDVPGETMPGAWVRKDTYEDWELADVGGLSLEVDGRPHPLDAPGGLATIDLRELAAGLPRESTLRLKLKAQTPKGPLEREFTYKVADLIGAP